MARNAFDYLEFTFKKIFSLEWLKKLQSSLIVGVSFTLVQTILFFWMMGLLLSQFHQIASWYEILPLLTLILGIYILIVLTLFMIEISFYAIIIPYCFYGNVEQGNFGKMYQLWKSFFWKYMTYITYYWLTMIGIIALFVGCYILSLFVEEPLFSFLASIVFIFLYAYINVRLVIAWYSVFFLPSNNNNYLINSWSLLKWKVWSTFVKTCIFFFIVSIGSGISTYIAQLFIPDTSEKIIDEMEHFSQLTTTPQIQDIYNMFQTLAGPILYSLIILLIFYKLAQIFSLAMRHVFLMEYYKDVSDTNPVLPEIIAMK